MVHFWGSLQVDHITLYHKEITFLLNAKYQIDFNYSMPENILSEGEINNIEKQIRTFKNSN